MKEGLIHTHEEMAKLEEEILSHEKEPQNILQLQMSLAEELYELEHGGNRPEFDTREKRNAILEYWGNSGYSLPFRNLVDEKIKKGENPMYITLAELKRFRVEIEL